MVNMTTQLLAFNDDLLSVVGYIATAFGGLFILYAVYLGILMATASDANKQAEAKRRIINAISMIVILICLITLLSIMEPKINTVGGGGITISVTGSGSSWTVTMNGGNDEERANAQLCFLDGSTEMKSTMGGQQVTIWSITPTQEGSTTWTVTRNSGASQTLSTQAIIILKVNGTQKGASEHLTYSP
ncbi:MAG: pilin [Christensenellaceae bacterium]|jgi:hypothetical protein|nr:pilin [Christensenellaceae bacterium]